MCMCACVCVCACSRTCCSSLLTGRTCLAAVAVLFDGVQQELNTFALDESKGTNENLKKLTAAMGTYKDSAVTFVRRVLLLLCALL